AADVEFHVRDCAACREFSEGVRQSMALLRAAHAEPLAPAALAAVRIRVLERMARRQWPLAPWAWGGGMAAAATAVWLVLMAPPVEPPRITIARPPAPQVETPAPRPLTRVRRLESVKKPLAPAAEPLLVKIVTDDPDVVIYWIV